MLRIKFRPNLTYGLRGSSWTSRGPAYNGMLLVDNQIGELYRARG